ncbi:6,7-dimethyl-8-ribityllumazine synthase [Catalinimonas alkaloidigena]|uniref:6,7-dimethyl-8-ribityllumazine synthase n=1 Tax=Catalinimonas alkaloidigena TaxID=1075417 RepID=UPI0024072554|nr:6,7-dimethyl-8-ribityllumazine synthase [Catalinimonas alkaloidigena]MDF9799858.1 6,7-dimethyl-8-ribityllumazine synthase [Catalinimonas alkaloidigena]
MSTAHKNLSDHKTDQLPDISTKKFAIVTAEWNEEITGAMYEGAFDTLTKHGALASNITSKWVPGSFELCLGAQWLAEDAAVDAVIAIGCVIQGETPHFDYICQAVAQGIKDINLKYNKPVIFGVLTTDNLAQAQDRAGGKHGNKGDEAAFTAIKMLGF